MKQQPLHHNPWPGLAPYRDPSEYKDGYHYKFCGRAAETFDLLQMIENRSLVTLYGATGIGKTSLLRAGVFPLLKQHINDSLIKEPPMGFHPVYIRLATPEQLGNDNDSSLEYKSLPLSLLLRLCIERELRVDQEEGAVHCENARTQLWHYFHTRRFYHQKERVTPVIVLDQFEELFNDSDNDARVGEFLQQLYVLIENRIPWRTEAHMHEATFRFVISLREDRFFYLEDYIDSMGLTLFKENRYRLHPMDPDSQALQVITLPGADIIDKDNQIEIARRIVDKSRNNDRKDVNTLMLSLICSQLFERKGCLTLDTTRDIDLTLDSYYQSAINGLPDGEAHFIESNFVNGDVRQPVEERLFKKQAPTAYQRFYKDEDSDYRIITGVVVPGKNSRHVELVHDQLASVINARQKAKDRRWRTAWLRMAVVALTLLAGALLVFWGQSTGRKSGQSLSLMRIDPKKFSTTDSLWIDQKSLKNDARVEHLSVVGKTKYSVEQCPYLHTIDLSHLGRDTLQLKIANCDVLSRIVLPENLQLLNLDVKNCPKLTLTVNKGLGDLHITPSEEALSISIEPDVERYKEKGGVLWDIYDRRIAYFPRAMAADIKDQTFAYSFPEEIKNYRLVYGRVTLNNREYKKVDDGMGTTTSTLYLSSKNQQQIDAWTTSAERESDESNCYVLPDSLDYIPSGMFESKLKLDSVKMPTKLSEIRSEAFMDCRQLQEIQLPANLQIIGDKAFMGCLTLHQLIVPKGVTSIGKQAFEGCAALETVVFLGDSVALGDRAFANCPNLKSVRLPRRPYSNAKTNYRSPFYQSGEFDGKEQFVASDRKSDVAGRYPGYELAASAEGMLIVRLAEGTSEIYLPVGYVQHRFHFEPNASMLNHIHVPWPQPEYIQNGYKCELQFSLARTDKQHITLHVPYGCKRYYEMNKEFADFMNIVEDPMMQQTRNWVSDILLLARKSSSRPVSVVIIVCSALLLMTAAIAVQRKWWRLVGLGSPSSWALSVWRAVLFSLSVLLLYTVFFWFFRLYCSVGMPLAPIMAAVLALLMSIALFLARQCVVWLDKAREKGLIRKGTVRERFDSFFNSCRRAAKSLLHAKQTAIGIGIACVAAAICVVYYKLQGANTYSSALASGNYDKAIRIFSDSLERSGRMTVADSLQLRSLLALSGDSARLVLVSREHYDHCDHNYELPWPVHNAISFFRNDSLFMFNADRMVVWCGKDPFDRGNSFSHDAAKLTVAYYDQQSDSTAVMFVGRGAELKVAGKLSNIMAGEEFVITARRDGSHLIYDYEGRCIPYIGKAAMLYLYRSDYFIATREGDGRQYLFTHTATGPACTILPKGTDYAGRSQSGSSSFTRSENRKDGTVTVTNTKTGKSFDLPQRFAELAGTITYHYAKDRYFWQGDYLYNEVALFDAQQGGRLIAELQGTSCTFLQRPDNVFYTKSADSLRFYVIDDGAVYHTCSARNNLPKDIMMDSYYRFRGNYLIHDEQCDREANHYGRRVHSLTIPGAERVFVADQPVFACGDSLMVASPSEQCFYIYRYETLKEQLMRSKKKR